MSRRRQGLGIVLALAGVPVLTALLLPLRDRLELDTALRLYLLAVVITSAVGAGRPPHRRRGRVQTPDPLTSVKSPKIRPTAPHDIRAARQTTLDAAWLAHPERFNRRPTPPRLPQRVTINDPANRTINPQPQTA